MFRLNFQRLIRGFIKKATDFIAIRIISYGAYIKFYTVAYIYYF